MISDNVPEVSLLCPKFYIFDFIEEFRALIGEIRRMATLGRSAVSTLDVRAVAKVPVDHGVTATPVRFPTLAVRTLALQVRVARVATPA